MDNSGSERSEGESYLSGSLDVSKNSVIKCGDENSETNLTSLINEVMQYMVPFIVSAPLPLKYFYPPIQKSHPTPFHKKHHVTPLSFFLERKSIHWFTDIIKSFKSLDFWKYVSHIITLWYYTWKHSQTYCNEVYHMYKSLYTSCS